MYRVVKSSDEIKDRVVLNLGVDVYDEHNAILSSIKPIYDENNVHDPIAQKEYNNFIDDVNRLFKKNNFICESHWSKSNRDYSISMYSRWTKDSVLMNPGKTYVVNVRISDHRLSDSGYSREDKWHTDQFNEMKSYSNKQYLEPQTVEILINDKKFHSYKDALNELSRILSGLMMM